MKKVTFGIFLIATPLVLTALLAIWFKQPLLEWYLYPPTALDEQDVPNSPDYRLTRYWSALPEINGSIDLQPAGVSLQPQEKSVDVFFVQPTTFFGPGKWNATMSNQEFAALGTEHVIATMASVFNSCCDIYAPRYRQAHLAAFLNKDAKPAAYRALDIAYEDVENAFLEFLKKRDARRPFIIAGHSQGTLHATRLINRNILNKPLRKQMVAAYIIGYWLPADKLSDSLGDIPLCESETMTGCFVTYDTYDNSGPGRLPGGSMPFWFPNGWQWVSGEQTLCVNPLSWQANTNLVSSDEHLGAIPMQKVNSMKAFLSDTNPNFTYTTLGTPDVKYTSAQCRADGSLMVSLQEGSPYDNSGAGKDLSLHPNDWNLFYMDLRANAQTRIESFFVR